MDTVLLNSLFSFSLMDTAFLVPENDALGVAVVHAGALTYYDQKRCKKRALAMAAVHGCSLCRR